MYECLKDGLPPLAERNLVADWYKWPLFFGTVVYSFESISIVSVEINWFYLCSYAKLLGPIRNVTSFCAPGDAAEE